MVELCRECFFKVWHPYMDAATKLELEKDIVMSEDCEICEGCGNCVPYVHHIGKEITCEEYDEAMSRIADIFAELGNS